MTLNKIKLYKTCKSLNLEKKVFKKKESITKDELNLIIDYIYEKHVKDCELDEIENFRYDIITYLKEKFDTFENIYKINDIVLSSMKKKSKKKKFNKEEKERSKILSMLRKIKQHEQRSKEWFEQRKNMITASSIHHIIGSTQYSDEAQYYEDKVYPERKKRTDNKYTHHGVIFEPIATMIYENLYDTKVDEFGLIQHFNSHLDKGFKPRKIDNKIIETDFLGASPDGISAEKKYDGKLNPLVGRLLEIKCPYNRKINTEGDNIIPPQYYDQVQFQLECCGNLDKCDFFQCNIKNISKKEYFNNVEPMISEGKNGKMITDYNNKIKQGMYIRVLEKSCLELDNYNFKYQYIYPKSIDISYTQYLEFIKEILDNLDHNKYIFKGIFYWRLIKAHNITVERDDRWFTKNYPKLKSFWNKVIEGRKLKKEKLLNKSNQDIKEDVKYDQNIEYCQDSDSD